MNAVKPTVNLIQVILALALIVLIVIQQKGSGLGSTFGGNMSIYRTKRGAEKMIFYLTILVTILFLASSILGLLI